MLFDLDGVVTRTAQQCATRERLDALSPTSSYRIIELFSEGLYTTPNKAIEELVSKAFDAGATNVHVILSPDRTVPDAFIAVIDDGIGMQPDDLRRHWLIGVSNKREIEKPPKGRKQIGKFGIGKLATFVLSSH
ncbi:MAG: ATP-binding protein [Candidatus Rokubacteria bacterium]|nr:ATP-binding protein [Candidatus Rokubacteria bacterium]